MPMLFVRVVAVMELASMHTMKLFVSCIVRLNVGVVLLVVAEDEPTFPIATTPLYQQAIPTPLVIVPLEVTVIVVGEPLTDRVVPAVLRGLFADAEVCTVYVLVPLSEKVAVFVLKSRNPTTTVSPLGGEAVITIVVPLVAVFTAQLTNAMLPND